MIYAVLLHMSSIDLSLDPMTSALTGMACLGVAIVGGPLTMSFLVLEMTRNLDVSAGVLAACFVTSVAVRGIFGHSFSTWRLHLRGEMVRKIVGFLNESYARRRYVEELDRATNSLVA
jgi:CIC family chloride channel protein